MSLSGILLGLINVAIYVAIMILVGLIIVWFASHIGWAIPDNIQKTYLAIVGLIALGMIVGILLGAAVPRIVGNAPPPFRGGEVTSRTFATLPAQTASHLRPMLRLAGCG